MEGEAEERLLRLRLPVSDRYWREYGPAVAVVPTALLALAVVLADGPREAVLLAALYLGLSLGAVLAGLAVYNVVVVALLATQR